MKPGTTRLPASDQAQEIVSLLADCWLPRIYRERILTTRTRAYHFDAAPRTGRAEVQHTLLGVELKVGRRRYLCPDLATARYLSVFARAGCGDVAIPYDITQISCFADELESSWQRMLLFVENIADKKIASEYARARIRGLLIAKLRAEIGEAGAGAEVPQFKQSTRQRRAV
jgi:hypothetical protein